jgi:hypothetical protein
LRLRSPVRTPRDLRSQSRQMCVLARKRVYVRWLKSVVNGCQHIRSWLHRFASRSAPLPIRADGQGGAGLLLALASACEIRPKLGGDLLTFCFDAVIREIKARNLFRD